MIPFTNPVNTDVVPDPGRTPVTAAVTPMPTVAPAPERLATGTVRVWSALSSMYATLSPFAQEPGFLAAYNQFTDVSDALFT